MQTSLKALRRFWEQTLITDRTPFHAAAMSAVDGQWSSGRLPDEYVTAYSDDKPSYTVLSYATPIAWFGKRGWVVPEVKYSVTTSRHQSIVRTALRNEEVTN